MTKPSSPSSSPSQPLGIVRLVDLPRYRDFRQAFDPAAIPEDSPGDHSSWTTYIEQRLEANRDLMLVAGMRQTQRLKLKALPPAR